MRTCDEIGELLSARLDGALSAAEEAELAEHLQACAACRALSEDLAVLHEVMPALNVEPPPALLQGVMERIRAETPAPVPFPDEAARARRNRRKWRTWGATAAVLAVVVFSAAALRMVGVASPAAVAGGASGGENAFSLERSAETGAEPRDQAMDGAGQGAGGGTEGLRESASPRPALRTAGEEVLADGAISEPHGPAPGGSRENAASGPAPACVEPSPVLTEKEALQLLYEEKFAADYPDAAYVESGGFEGYTLSPPATVRGEADQRAGVYLALRGQSGNGAYYLFERFVQTIDASDGRIVGETVWDRYAVPLAGGDILSEEEDADAFASAIGK